MTCTKYFFKYLSGSRPMINETFQYKIHKKYHNKLVYKIMRKMTSVLDYLNSFFNFQNPIPLFRSNTHILFSMALNKAELEGGNLDPNSASISCVEAFPIMLQPNRMKFLISEMSL
mmetsp:Transcript_19850/g.32947  ORF Transcript_19850/g.32947 Transcript_19850/m.32947 type:complete len:116 (-) Transcript_19850:124-471(-)